MNPLIALLMRLARAQTPFAQARTDLRSGGGYTPQAQQLLNQVRMNFLNPGNGRIGQDALGTGILGNYGFGGYYRGSPLDSYEGVPSNVGNISMMRGDAPAMNASSSQALARLFGNNGPSWSASNWLNQLTNMSGANANPYPDRQQNNGAGLLNGGSLFGENSGAEFHGGGAGMLDFLRGPTTLQGMDALFNGSGRGGSGDPGTFGVDYLV